MIGLFRRQREGTTGRNRLSTVGELEKRADVGGYGADTCGLVGGEQMLEEGRHHLEGRLRKSAVAVVVQEKKELTDQVPG